jgi:hypothetical protein
MLSGATVMKVREHIIKEPQHVLDETRHVVPLVPGLDVERGEAAHGSALLVAVVLAGGERDLAAEVRRRDLQPQLALVPRHGAVHCVDEQEIGLAGLQPRLQDALPELPGVDLAYHALLFGLRSGKRAPSRTACMNASVTLMP